MAWHNACCNWTVGLPGWGNANTWAPNATAHPDYNVVPNPVVGSIGCSDGGTWGHVVWVIAVNGSSIDVSEMNCCSTCNYGSRIWTYQASYFNQGFIVRTSCNCSAGDVETQGCPLCGTQERTCDGCNWNSWGACQNQGPCASGQTETGNCGDCGTHDRTCQGNCQWGSWSTCEGPDPLTPCDSGQPGLCAEGQLLCTSGNHVCEQTVFPADETCDGRDEDCDGVTDEDGVCGGTDASVQPDASTGSDGGPPPPDAAAPADDGGGSLDVDGGGSPADPGIVRGGCHCRTDAGSLGALPAILWLLLLAGLRRWQ
jgi:hypothetical protein